MKRDFSAVINDLDGNPVREGMSVETMVKAFQEVFPTLSLDTQLALNAALDKHAGKPLTLGSACVSTLLRIYEGEERMEDSVRLDRMELARKLNKGGIIDIDPTKERDLVKPLLKKRFAGSILIPVVCAELLEQDVDKPEPLKSVA